MSYVHLPYDSYGAARAFVAKLLRKFSGRTRVERDDASRAGKSRKAQRPALRDANWKHFVVVTILTFSSK